MKTSNEIIAELRIIRIDVINNDNTINALMSKNPERWEIKKALKVWKRNSKMISRRLDKIEREIKKSK